jgi:site-specific DNA-methyltransferase (adenine-specific)
LLERCIAMTTDPGDLVIDPFGGTGTTYYAAEKLQRRWLGIELGDVEPAIQRLKDHAAGEHPEWESARGIGRNGRRVQQNRTQLGLLTAEAEQD